MKQVNEAIQSMSEDQTGLDFECIGVWVTVVDTVIVTVYTVTVKVDCTCDTPSWIPPEITVRL